MHLSMSCGGGGGGGAWGGDLTVFVGPGVWHLTDLVVAGVGGGCLDLSSPNVKIFDCRLGRKRLILKIMFPASTLHACASWSGKIWKSLRPTGTSESWVDFTVCLQISLVLACFWSIEPLKILWYQSKRKWRETKSILARTIDQCMAHSLQSLYKACKTDFLCTLN